MKARRLDKIKGKLKGLTAFMNEDTGEKLCVASYHDFEWLIGRIERLEHALFYYTNEVEDEQYILADLDEDGFGKIARRTLRDG